MTQGNALFEHYIHSSYCFEKAAQALRRAPKSVMALPVAELNTVEAFITADTDGTSRQMGVSGRRVAVEAVEQLAKLRVLKGG